MSKKKRVLVKVTQELINIGDPLDGDRCPIALAYYEATGKHAYVGDEYTLVDGECHDHSYRVKRFVKRFDLGLPVKPQNFLI